MRNIRITEYDNPYTMMEKTKKQIKEVEAVKGNVDRILGDKAQEQAPLGRKDTRN